MKNDNLKNSLSVLGGIVFMVITVGAFMIIWRQSQPQDTDALVEAANAKYQIVDISSEEQFAADLVRDKANLANMPILAPASDKVGRDNPFAGL